MATSTSNNCSGNSGQPSCATCDVTMYLILAIQALSKLCFSDCVFLPVVTDAVVTAALCCSVISQSISCPLVPQPLLMLYSFISPTRN